MMRILVWGGMRKVLRMNGVLGCGVKKWNGGVKRMRIYRMVVKSVLEMW